MRARTLIIIFSFFCLALYANSVAGDYLIDDDSRWEERFEGTFIYFNELEPEKSWANALWVLGVA